MYHSISDDPETGHPYYWINTKPALFAEHMKFLHDNNYQVIPLSTAVGMIRAGNPKSQTLNPKSEIQNVDQSTNQLITQSTSHLPDPNQPINQSTNYVVLTFDDGYLDFYTQAFPVLRQYGFTATVFLPTDYIDGSRPGLRGKKHLTWDLVAELNKSGIDFGSHTCSHPQLYDLQPNEIELELRKSKETIESNLSQSTNHPLSQSTSSQFNESTNQPLNQSTPSQINQLPTSPINQSTNHSFRVTSFCYPYKFFEGDGSFVKSIEGALRDSGYNSCTTTRIGTGNNKEDLYSLKRIPVNSADDEIFFLTKLTGGYNWLYSFQVFRKSILTPKKQVPAGTPSFIKQSTNQLSNH
jgi:peptidoglycan/xylan/chitin deacetylase (PgdA/CDA1 family)